MRARAHGRGQRRGVLTAALALIALTLQLFSPVMCQAQTRAKPQTMVVCTSHGLKTITLDDQPTTPPSRCEHCTAAHVVAEPTGPAQVAVVLYVSAVPPAPDTHDNGPAFARAPPRPPSQAPPILIQT